MNKILRDTKNEYFYKKLFAMNRFFLAIIFLLSFAAIASAQNITAEEVKYFDNTCYNGKITISQDPALENFIETHVGLNKKRRGFYGYRVKIYAQNHQNARSQANAIKIGFGEDGQQAYVTYVEPNFEVHVGDYTKRFEAVALLNKIQSKYPEAYTIKTVVSYPRHD
jgi:hypothetical protein